VVAGAEGFPAAEAMWAAPASLPLRRQLTTLSESAAAATARDWRPWEAGASPARSQKPAAMAAEQAAAAAAEWPAFRVRREGPAEAAPTELLEAVAREAWLARQ